MTKSGKSSERSRGKLGFRGAAAACALAAGGCGGVEAPREQVETVSQAYDSGVFLTWSSTTPRNTGGFTDSMAVCPVSAQFDDDGSHWTGMLLLGRHSSGASANRFRYGLYYKAGGWRAWPNLGTATFNSKPACTPLNEPNVSPTVDYWSNQVAIVGKGADNRYSLRIMELSTIGGLNVPPGAPSFPVDWHTISSDVYASAPFAATEIGCLIVGGRTSETTPSHSHIYIHLNCMSLVPQTLLEYDQDDWRPRVVLPALPSGWSAIGDAAIAAEGQGIVHIVTRAQNSSGQTRLYTANIFVPFLPLYGQLVNGVDGGPVAWTQIPNGGIPVHSDPSVSFDVGRQELTVYYRGGNQQRIFQSTRTSSGTWPSFAGIHNDAFGTAPAATANLLADWSHLVVARSSTDAEQVWLSGIDPRAFD